MKPVKIKRKGGIKSGKGARYERAMCQRLSLWVSRMRREDVFWRSAMSGGRATLMSRKARKSAPLRVRDKDGKVKRISFDAHCGDIVATHAVGNLLTQLFVLECKHYKSLDAHKMFFGKGGKVTEFWKKVLEEAKDTNREPLLVMRQNNQPDVICTTAAGKEILQLKGKVTASAYFPPLGMWVYVLRDVLSDCDFDCVRKAHQHPEAVKDLFK